MCIKKEREKMTTAKLLTEKETCKYLACSRSYLASSRSQGDLPGRTPGPKFVRLGKSGVRYDVADLDAWIDANRHGN